MAKVIDFFTPDLEEELTLGGDRRFEPQPVRAPGVCVSTDLPSHTFLCSETPGLQDRPICTLSDTL